MNLNLNMSPDSTPAAGRSADGFQGFRGRGIPTPGIPFIPGIPGTGIPRLEPTCNRFTK